MTKSDLYTNRNLSKKNIDYNLILFKRKELRTTERELKAMATAAKIGFKRIPKNGYKTPAATGIKAEL